MSIKNIQGHNRVSDKIVILRMNLAACFVMNHSFTSGEEEEEESHFNSKMT